MSEIPFADWEPIIGLEIHAQLNTRTKMFSRTLNRFGDEPNTNVGLIDTAQPGTLPIINKEAVKKAVKFGCAINAEVSHFSAFDRKSYFYPDSPRNFQITQFYHPIIQNGSVKAFVDGEEKEFGIRHAHLEDDSGMLKHFSSFAGVDYNRAGVPLIEIVSEPCMFSPKDASAYAQAIRTLLIYLDVSDCNMDQGSLRMDVNISVRKKGERTLRNKVEIKNMNSFSNMEMAIESEIRRQIRAYTKDPYKNPSEIVRNTTLRFDLEKKETVEMRTKEQAEDYRYFPEPDLPPIYISAEQVEKVRRNLPELPQQRLERYQNSLGLSEYNAALLVNDKPLSDFFECGLKNCKNPKTLCNWITVEFAGKLKEKNLTLASSNLKAQFINSLVNMIETKMVTGKIAKLIADQMILSPEKDPEQIFNENPDFQPLSNTGEIEAIITEVLTNNEQSVSDFKNGIEKAFNFLVGQIMKASKGKADPSLVKEILTKKLHS